MMYKQRRFLEIIQYIKDEAEDFIKSYRILKKELPLLAASLQKDTQLNSET